MNKPIDIDFEKLKAVNKDIVGWIYIDGVKDISYPILKGQDNEHYLNHTYKNTKNIAGSIFMDFRNESDFMDCNTIIYGNNMKNKIMFSKLDQLLKNPGNTNKKPYIWIFTPTKTMVYKIFSVHEEPYTSDTYSIYKDAGDEYYDFSKTEYKKNQVDGLKLNDNANRMCTLSTCTDNDDIRMVVQCELVDTIHN